MAIMMQYFLPVIPDSAPIVIPVNQYDYDDPNYAGRLVFNLIYEGQTYDMTGATATIQGTKPDGTEFAYQAAVSGSIVRAKLTQQMTAVYGRTVGNIIVLDGDGNRVGTFAFWLEVQKSALSGDPDPSETEIPALIALATAQAQAAQQSATEAASSADAAAAWSANPPYIGLNGDWYVYNVNTELYEDSGVDARGRNGTKWYYGTAITGKSTTPTAYNTGIPMAYEGDGYLSLGEGAIYACTSDGGESTALWAYQMTLSGGGGATVLNDLTDVTIAMLANGQILQYDSASNKWKNVNLPTLTAAISTLTDVALASLQDGQILQYNGVSGKWENATVSPGGATSLAALTDVALTSLADGQMLIYDSASGKWKNANIPQGGHTMLPTPGVGTDEDDVVSAVNTAVSVDGGANDDVPSLFGMGVWTNVKKFRRVIDGSNGDISASGIGTWTDKDTTQITAADETDWWYDAAFVVPSGVDPDSVDIKFYFVPPADGEPIVRRGFIWDTDTGKLCIAFADEITDPTTAKIAVDISYVRNEVV